MRTIISASRRTDIPGFYMRWFEHRVRDGFVDVRNPVVKEKTYRVSLCPEDVHTIVLWSKNYRPFLDSPLSSREDFLWYFNFSLVDAPDWELGVTPLKDRMKQVKEICRRWSPTHVNWRFDPILFWDNGRKNNLNGFEKLCDFMSALEITWCTFSFVTWYNKVKKRDAVKVLDAYDPPFNQKIDILSELVGIARLRGITMESCCNDDLLQVKGIIKGHCISSLLLSHLAGERASMAHDTSQRKDCGCTKSTDIGSYQMSCPHNCLYCYAKPVDV